LAAGLSPSAGTYTVTSLSPTATYPPISTAGTAIDTAWQFYFYGNADATTYTPTPPTTGSAITVGTGGLSNLIDMNTGNIICLNTTSSGCNGTVGGVSQVVGDFNSLYSLYNSILGTTGFRIQ
jgi:hypothetical protein